MQLREISNTLYNRIKEGSNSLIIRHNKKLKIINISTEGNKAIINYQGFIKNINIPDNNEEFWITCGYSIVTNVIYEY